MINYLKLSAYFFLGVGILFSLGIFALKIFFYDNHNDSLNIDETLPTDSTTLDTCN